MGQPECSAVSAQKVLSLGSLGGMADSPQLVMNLHLHVKRASQKAISLPPENLCHTARNQNGSRLANQMAPPFPPLHEK